MNGLRNGNVADSSLVHGWLNARSVARGVPAPVADRGGWRVDTRSDAEICRYVFAAPDTAITDLAHSITLPRIFLKLCTEDRVFAPLLPGGWQLLAPSWLMTTDTECTKWALPTGYEASVEQAGKAIKATILAPGRALAASGYAAEVGGFFVYDRIVTQADHRRLGLGRAIMTLLGARRTSQTSQQVLVATDQGRALYTALGWQVKTPYASAVIPDREF